MRNQRVNHAGCDAGLEKANIPEAIKFFGISDQMRFLFTGPEDTQ